MVAMSSVALSCGVAEDDIQHHYLMQPNLWNLLTVNFSRGFPVLELSI
uniref:Uncharacterized protein n=1 Tax=Pseudomonas fluorescens (strain SBW25) TaxID=216595 RepID=A0A0G4E4Y0_PSEFS|nr:hypothetical protein PQBR57_0281 [Pseudomonas fluorescens SBW25]